VTRLAHLAGLVSLAALVGCAGAPARPVPPVRARPAGPVCAVPPRGPAPAGPGPAARPAPDAGLRPGELVAGARQLRSDGDHAGAQRLLEQAAVLAPDDAEVCLELADLLVADDADLDRAGAMLLAIPAGHPRRDATLGRLAELRGDPAGAEAAYARELAVADDPEVRLRRALVLERLGRDAEATVELERLRAADPDDAVVRARLAERYEAAGRLREAEAELRALAEASPGRPDGWRRLAAFCTRHGLTDKARAAEARARDAEASPQRVLRPLKPTGR
jgi:tetratricopeptide (TPR) repeat protein